MAIDKKKVGIISGISILVAGLIAYLVYRDEKTLKDRYRQCRSAIKEFFVKKEAAKT